MSDETRENEKSEIQRQYLRKKIREHLMGPFGSVLLHILIVFLAVKFMVGIGEKETSSVEVQIMEMETIDLEEFEKELEQLDDMPEMTDMIAPPDQQLFESPPDVAAESAAPAEDVSMDLADLNVVSDAKSPLVMKGLYEGRSAAGRSKMLGGAGKWAQATEASVIKALEWLRVNQKPDGSWAGQSPVAMTGLAILTYLAHGETPTSEKYGPTVEKAIKFLVGQQEKRGKGIFNDWSPGGGGEGHGGGKESYEHGIVTYALSEAYGLTRIPSLKPVMESAVQVIIDGQQPGGSWDYGFKKGARRDASVAGWQIQALKAASMAGASNPGLKEALKKGAEDLIASQNPENGRFPYSDTKGKGGAGHHPGSMSITGVGVLCLQIAGYANDNSVDKGLKALKEAEINFKDPMAWPMYSWYYITQAKFQSGGMDWDAWNRVFAKELIENQNPDGSWSAAHREGDDGHGGVAETKQGPVYSTTLAALTLQVYYRFLPTYKPVKVEEKKPAVEDVKVEII